MLSKADFQKIQKLISDSREEIKDLLVTFKDEILGEIRDLREEVTIVTGYKDQIEDHEERIEKLEKAVRHS